MSDRPKTGAERAREYRRRQGITPRELSDDPVARAKRRIRRGATREDLDPLELDALRRYENDQAKRRRETRNRT